MSEFSTDDVDFSAISIGNARFAVWCATEDEANCLVEAAKDRYPAIGDFAFDDCTYFQEGGTYYFLHLNNPNGSGPYLTYSWNSHFVASNGYTVIPFTNLLKSTDIEPSDENILMLVGGFDG